MADMHHPREVFDLVGHEAAEAAFEASRARGRLHHAWLLIGPEGVGKATFAYRAARRLLGAPEDPAHGILGASPDPTNPASASELIEALAPICQVDWLPLVAASTPWRPVGPSKEGASETSSLGTVALLARRKSEPVHDGRCAYSLLTSSSNAAATRK